MKTNYTIKNFRVFDEDGVTINFAPLTILTGCNSSGKSSVARSCLLLDSFLSDLREKSDHGKRLDISTAKLDFTKHPNNLLGKFGGVINKSADDKEISFVYTVYSNMLGAEVEVELIFRADEMDTLDNGYLHTLIVRLDGSELFATSKDNSVLSDLTLAKRAFFEFIVLEALSDAYVGLEGTYDIERKISREEYESQKSLILNAINGIDENRRKDIYRYIRLYRKDRDSILAIKKLGEGIVDHWERIMMRDFVGRNMSQNNFVDYNPQSFSLIRIPLATRMENLSKDEQVEELTALLDKETDQDIKYFIGRVIANFADSDQESLSDYLLYNEDDWLANFVLGQSNLLRPKFGLPDNGSIKIPQNKFVYIPKNIVGEVNLFGVIEKKLDPSKEMDSWLDGSFGFPEIYESIMRLNILDGQPDETSEYYNTEVTESYHHYLMDAFSKFVAQAFEEVMLPLWSGGLEYVGSTRVNIRRLYDVQENSDFSKLLRSYFEAKRVASKLDKSFVSNDKRFHEPDSFMNKWVELFGIGESVSIIMDEDATGVKIYLEHFDGTKSLLADEGYGITQLVSILLQIETSIMGRRRLNISRPYGLQSLDNYPEDKHQYAPTTIVIEEPEIHLHPRYQSLLADMLVEAVQKYNIHFIVETHSEYLIRKLQVLVGKPCDAERKVNPEDIAIYYVDRYKGNSSVRKIEICEDGYLDSQFGEGFYDEASSLSQKLL